MKQNPIDFPIAAAGITAPVWLEPLNQWLALAVAVGSLILIGYRLHKIIKGDR